MSLIENEFIISAIAIIGIVSAPLFMAALKNNSGKRFRQQIKLGVIKGRLTYQDMQDISERWSQDRKAILFSLRIMHSEAISGEDEKLADSVDKLRRLIDEHHRVEPFAELPEDVSLQLCELQSIIGKANYDKISRLAVSLSDIYAVNLKNISKQKKLALWGFITGALGIVVGIAGLYSNLNGA